MQVVVVGGVSSGYGIAPFAGCCLWCTFGVGWESVCNHEQPTYLAER